MSPLTVDLPVNIDISELMNGIEGSEAVRQRGSELFGVMRVIKRL